MVSMFQVYKCEHCGIVAEVLHNGGGKMICCGEEMKLYEAKTAQSEGKEKHVPVIQKTQNGNIIKVGSVPHPMEVEHYIEWIEFSLNGTVTKKYLKPGETPEMICNCGCGTDCDCTVGQIRAYCNKHGLWQGE